MSRINPFENLADDFPLKSKTQVSKSVENEKELIDRIAEDNNFPSRQAAHKEEPVKQQRRYRTGRNQQINIKATEQTISKFYQLADKENITLGELLERALNAFEKS
jgi:DNA-binding protein H-NS